MDLDRLVQLIRSNATHRLSNAAQASELSETADKCARYIAQHLDKRASLLQRIEDDGGTAVDDLAQLWTYLAASFSPSDINASDVPDDLRIQLVTSLAKFERNIVAGFEEAQAIFIEHEPMIRNLIFSLTSFDRIEESKYTQVLSILTQLLSNLVSPIEGDTGSETRGMEKFYTYLSGQRSQDIIIRLLDSKDAKVNIATLHLITNLSRSKTNCEILLSRRSGVSWLSRILDKLDTFHSETNDSRFDIASSLFTNFIELNLHWRLFGALTAEGEPITPSQTILLKVLDSYMASTLDSRGSKRKGKGPEREMVETVDNSFLIPVFHVLSVYAAISIKGRKDDPRLAKVLEGSLLVVEIFVTIGLSVQAQKDQLRREEEEAGMETNGSETNPTFSLVCQLKESGEKRGIIKPSIDLLRELEKFYPRMNARISRSSTQPVPDIPPDQATPITQLKKLLVQLLGILSFEDIGVGDQVREVGGVQLVLSMTEMDENNPYLREHALLCIRNLMMNNPSNQAVIKQMDPVGVLGQDGELLPLPDKMKGHPEQTK